MLRASLTFCLLAALTVAPRPASAAAFSEVWLREHARSLAQGRYVPPPQAPPELEALDYDALRSLRFLPHHALWKKEGRPFQLQFFHVGGHVRESVQLFTVRKGTATAIPFDPSHFDASRVKAPREALAQAGYSGFRAHAAINRADYLDEVLVFLGASYFRALGRDQGYGLSARGLAIDTALAKGEEFPRFTTFWIEEPTARSEELVVHALLDSPSVTGAYRFVVRPGHVTRMDVNASLFARRGIAQLGLAPLTSMYLHGENDRSSVEDFRPEVHDSDGLLLWTGTGERLFRPLSNPARLQVSSFQVGALKGFGLLQRDGAFASYEDLEARYERRPSLWVEPRAGFEDGRVVLVEIPTPEEIHDNIGAFFVPAIPAKPGGEMKIAYRLHWGASNVPPPAPVREVVATRTSAGSAPGQRKWVVDFAASRKPDGRKPSAAPLEAMVTATGAKVLRPLAQEHTVTGGLRLTFELAPERTGPVELRCFVRRGDETLTETWSYLWTP